MVAPKIKHKFCDSLSLAFVVRGPMFTGIRKIGPKENSSSLQNVLGKLARKFADKFVFAKQCSVQILRGCCRKWAVIIAMDEMAIPNRYHW